MNDIAIEHSFLSPTPKFLSQMPFKFLKPVPKVPSTPPALKTDVLQVTVLVTFISPLIILRQWVVRQRDKEIGIEAVVVLSMLETLTMHIAADDMNMEMCHRRMSMQTDPHLTEPVTAGWDLFVPIFESLEPRPI